MPGTLTVSTLTDGTNTTSATNAILGSAKAWCAYSGSGSSIRGSFNISSVTKNTGGDYSPNFSTALTDGNYSATANHGGAGFASPAVMFSNLANAAVAPTASGFRFYISVWNNSTAGVDGNYQNITVLR